MHKLKQKTLKRRNLLHDHPLLLKCDVHEKSYKAKRRKQKVKLKNEWFDQSVISNCILMKLFSSVVIRRVALQRIIGVSPIHESGLRLPSLALPCKHKW